MFIGFLQALAAGVGIASSLFGGGGGVKYVSNPTKIAESEALAKANQEAEMENYLKLQKLTLEGLDRAEASRKIQDQHKINLATAQGYAQDRLSRSRNTFDNFLGSLDSIYDGGTLF